MNCPKCGSPNIIAYPITSTTVNEKVKGLGCIKACLGYLFFSIPGILCGLCGMGKGKSKVTHTTKMVNQCQNCNYRF